MVFYCALLFCHQLSPLVVLEAQIGEPPEDWYIRNASVAAFVCLWRLAAPTDSALVKATPGVVCVNSVLLPLLSQGEGAGRGTSNANTGKVPDAVAEGCIQRHKPPVVIFVGSLMIDVLVPESDASPPTPVGLGVVFSQLECICQVNHGEGGRKLLEPLPILHRMPPVTLCAVLLPQLF